MKKLLLIMTILLMSAKCFAFDFASIPNTFVTRQIIRASQINANYTAILNGFIDASKKVNVAELWVNGSRVVENDLDINGKIGSFSSNLNVSGNVTIDGTSTVVTTNITGDLSISNDLNVSSNLTVDGISSATTLSATALTGTLTTAAQTNLTSLGTLTSLDIAGKLTVDTTTLTVIATANQVGIKTATPVSYATLDVNGGDSGLIILNNDDNPIVLQGSLGGGGASNINFNSYFDGSVNKYIRTGYATRIATDKDNGGIAIATAASGTGGNTTTLATVFGIGPAGKVAIGATAAETYSQFDVKCADNGVVIFNNDDNPMVFQSTIAGGGASRIGFNSYFNGSANKIIKDGYMGYFTHDSDTGGVSFQAATTAATAADSVSVTTLFNVNAAGSAFFPLAYDDDINGATYRSLLIKDDGQLGYDSSTIRKKINVVDMEDISWFYQLRPVNFNYRKRDEANKISSDFYLKKKYGLIAEEVENIASEFVFYNPDGSVEGVHYREFVSVLIKVVQDQKVLIDDLEKRVEALEVK